MENTTAYMVLDGMPSWEFLIVFYQYAPSCGFNGVVQQHKQYAVFRILKIRYKILAFYEIFNFSFTYFLSTMRCNSEEAVFHYYIVVGIRPNKGLFP